MNSRHYHFLKPVTSNGLDHNDSNQCRLLDTEKLRETLWQQIKQELTSMISSSPSLFLFSLCSGDMQLDIWRKSGPGVESSVQVFCPGTWKKSITKSRRIQPTVQLIRELKTSTQGSSNIQARSGRDGAPRDVNHTGAALQMVRNLWTCSSSR
jgi:hypothetical protein